MRPVDKGAAPNNYSKYQDSRDDLICAIGRYCSYCEMSVQNMIEVEHIVPHTQGGEMLAWSNFLLSCKYCNTVKKARNTSRVGYLWPDKENTDFAYDYGEATIIQARPGTGVEIAAAAIIDLMGLDRNPAGPNFPTPADTRHTKRLEVWQLAKLSLENWKEAPSPAMATQIGITAGGHGFYSIWITVFAGIDDVKAQIVANFKGTYTTAVGGVRVVRPGAII